MRCAFPVPGGSEQNNDGGAGQIGTGGWKGDGVEFGAAGVCSRFA